MGCSPGWTSLRRWTGLVLCCRWHYLCPGVCSRRQSSPGSRTQSSAYSVLRNCTLPGHFPGQREINISVPSPKFRLDKIEISDRKMEFRSNIRWEIRSDLISDQLSDLILFLIGFWTTFRSDPIVFNQNFRSEILSEFWAMGTSLVQSQCDFCSVSNKMLSDQEVAVVQQSNFSKLER